MGQGGIAKRVIVWVTALTGSTRGSLPMTTIVSSELFGAMSHTSVGTVAAVGRLVYPALRDGGYSDRFTVSLIASSGAIAVVIPPSIAMILYSMSAQQSAVALFTAGILPSLLIGLVDAIYVVVYSRSRKVAVGEPRRRGRRSGPPPRRPAGRSARRSSSSAASMAASSRRPRPPASPRSIRSS